MWQIGMRVPQSDEEFFNIAREEEFHPSFAFIIPLEAYAAKACPFPVYFQDIPLGEYF